MNAARWFYSQPGFHSIRPEPPACTSCAWSLPGCLCPKKPHAPGEPLVSHCICEHCLASVRAENQARRVAR